MNKIITRKWWESTTIYHIYPRSFMDTDGNGIGDLNGILSKLDYLKDLGVETLWISPFYLSAQQDHGYDISDYFTVDPIFGNNSDANRLIEEVHKRGMKILFDMVMNHTSVEHEWFKQSRESVDSPKRDWYIWRKGHGEKKPPNNWMSMTGKKGWNYDKVTNEWYYASFLSFQPDLNYNNPEVIAAMFGVVRYWLEQGVDGFRLDIFNCIGKDERMLNNPFSWRYIPTPDNNHESFFQKKLYNFNHPASIDFAKKLRTVMDEYPDRFLIGEVSGSDRVLKQYMGSESDGLHSVFLFELIHFKFSKSFFKGFLEKIEKEFPHPFIPTYVFSNHDIGRFISRVGGDMEKAKCIALFQLTSRGIPILYYGDEIGMTNHNLPIRSAQDPLAIQFKWVPKIIAAKLGLFLNRDDGRTPMQWNNQKNAGFSTADQTWLPLVPDYTIRNVATQNEAPWSLLNVYKQLFQLRYTYRAIKDGKTTLRDSSKNVLVYSRETDAEHVLIAINLGPQVEIYNTGNSMPTVLLSTVLGQEIKEGTIILKPYSGLVVKL